MVVRQSIQREDMRRCDGQQPQIALRLLVTNNLRERKRQGNLPKLLLIWISHRLTRLR